MSTAVHTSRWSRPLAAIAFVAVVGAGLGAFFGIRAVQGAGSGSSAGQPPARTGAAMAYDIANRTVVLFGGQSKDHALNDTWIWDGSAWTEAHPVTSPPALANAQMTYDPVSHDLLLVGGQAIEGSPLSPIACSAGSGTSSSGSTQTFIPPGHPIPAIAPAPSATAHASGVIPGGLPDCATIAAPSTGTWLWNGSDWSKAAGSTPFVAFGGGTLATDPVSGRAVLLTRGLFAEPALGAAQSAPLACPVQAGAAIDASPPCPGMPTVAPTWTWNGHAWKAIASSPTTSSFELVGSSIVDDAVTGKLATFGGDFIAPLPTPMPCLGCAPGSPVKQSACCTGTESVWNGSAWKQVGTFKNGPPTPGITFTGDPAAHSDVLLTGDGQTWLWTGVWTRVHPGTTPTIVSGAASTYDAATGQVLMFGGFGAASRISGLYDQTWTWDGSNWSQRGGSSGPSVVIPVPSPRSVPPYPPCLPIPQPAKPAGTAAVQPTTICNGNVAGGSGSSNSSSGSTGGVPGSVTGSGPATS